MVKYCAKVNNANIYIERLEADRKAKRGCCDCEPVEAA